MSCTYIRAFKAAEKAVARVSKLSTFKVQAKKNGQAEIEYTIKLAYMPNDLSRIKIRKIEKQFGDLLPSILPVIRKRNLLLPYLLGLGEVLQQKYFLDAL